MSSIAPRSELLNGLTLLTYNLSYRTTCIFDIKHLKKFNLCLYMQVWYAHHYAERFGLQTLEITDTDIESMYLIHEPFSIHWI